MSAEKIISYKITNPYESIAELIENNEHHYKTNLHTHSTYSDANETMTKMIEAYYDYDFDILAFAEHGLLGKEWDKTPTIVPLYTFQYPHIVSRIQLQLLHLKKMGISSTQATISRDIKELRIVKELTSLPDGIGTERDIISAPDCRLEALP